ncbi:MAG: hypothetical protein JXL97_15150 [Bacteroidales bacterium]|nr:hypothetical protein [Bacteroidales bacterium]
MKKYADLHIHSTLKPITYKSSDEDDERGSIWFQDKPKKRQRDNDLVRYTQSDFKTLAQGKVKIAFVSLYPVEQGWFASHETGIIVDLIAHYATDFPIKRINQVQSDQYNYFSELQKEYNFLIEETKLPRTIDIEGNHESVWAKLPANASELENYMNEDNTIVIIPTIEGANNLIDGNANHIANFNLENTLSNIQKIKNWPVPPFFLTLSHHFFNGMTGHARSIFGKNDFQEFLGKILLTQAEGIESNITAKGWKVIKSLLAIDEFNGNGKRILIDTKHLNSKSRKEFYSFILNYNNNHPEDSIPLINSHCAYNNQDGVSRKREVDALDSKVFTDAEVFNEADLNINDIDVTTIYKTGGIIGLNLDERILSSKKIIDTADSMFNHKPTYELRLFWATQIVRNISAMVEAIMLDDTITDKSNVWNIFAIGSDFDGFINPVDGFITANEFEDLEYFLAQALATCEGFKNYNNKLTTTEIAEKIMFKNAFDFLKKHYWKDKKIA